MQHPNLEFELTEKQTNEISEVLIRLMNKYRRPIGSDPTYFEGVVDGLNHSYKLINGIDDDYLDGIE